MENIYCQNLEFNWMIDTTPLDKIRNNYTDTNNLNIFFLALEDIDKNLLAFVDSMGLNIEHAEIFYTPPNTKAWIHVDNDEFGTNRCKLNWVFGGKGSTMEWWWPKDEKAPLRHKITKIGTKYISFDYTECNKIYSAEVGVPSLVNTGVPHSVNNSSDQGRWCMSFNLYYCNSKETITWQDAAEKFKDFLT